MSRNTALLLLAAGALGALGTVLLSPASSPSSPTRGAGDPAADPRLDRTSVPIHSAATTLGRRRLPSLDDVLRDLAAVDPAAAVTSIVDGWTPSDELLTAFASEHQPHVVAVATYLNEVFAPRLQACVAPLRPTGWIEVGHSFVVDEFGIARPGLAPGEDAPPITLTDGDLDADTLTAVLDCMEAAGDGTSFPHVALFEQTPEPGFVTYQGYSFGPAESSAVPPTYQGDLP